MANREFILRKNELIREWQACKVEYAVGTDMQRAVAKQRAAALLKTIDEMDRLQRMTESAEVDRDVWTL